MPWRRLPKSLAGQFMIRSRTRVVKRHSGGGLVGKKNPGEGWAFAGRGFRSMPVGTDTHSLEQACLRIGYLATP
jgi:hypothetical protein